MSANSGRASGGAHRCQIILCCGTALAALGYALAGISGGIVGLSFALALAGAGSSTQHPLGVRRRVGCLWARCAQAARHLQFHRRSRQGGHPGADVSAACQRRLAPGRIRARRRRHRRVCRHGAVDAGRGHGACSRCEGTIQQAVESRGGFYWLLAIGMLDSAVRMGFLTFLPFLLIAKGATLPTSGLALALLFVGGAAGKFACGWLGDRIGTRRTVSLHRNCHGLSDPRRAGAAACPGVIVLLPALGVMLNGTSSVLYGTVPELTPPHRTARAFALFYTGTIGAGAGAPILYGFLGDAFGPGTATAATAMTALAICPFMIALSRHLNDDVEISDCASDGTHPATALDQ
jgi:FSR family fosmidomycin resistance protein-like MFS transporter